MHITYNIFIFCAYVKIKKKANVCVCKLTKWQCATHQMHNKHLLLSSETKSCTQTSLRSQVQIPRSHAKVGLLVHICNSITPRKRWEREVGEVPEIEGQLEWQTQGQATKRPKDPLSMRWKVRTHRLLGHAASHGNKNIWRKSTHRIQSPSSWNCFVGTDK